MPLLEKLGFTQKEDSELEDKYLLRSILSKFCNISQNLMEMIILHLPSPKTSQKYRISYLYKGPMDDECSKAMLSCDPKGPIMMLISKIIPRTKYDFYVFGRIFSGTIKQGEKVRLLGQNYKPGNDKDLYIKPINRVVIVNKSKGEDILDVPCGNICAIEFSDISLINQMTITSSPKAHIMKAMKFLKDPIFRMSINPKEPSQLPKLISNMFKISKIDPLLEINCTEIGHVLCCCSEKHLKKSIKDLSENIEIIESEPYITYKETVIKKSKINVTTSPNKHNKIYVNSEPLFNEVINEIEEDKNQLKDSFLEIPNDMIEKYENKYGLKNIWVFGPQYNGPNVLINQTEGINNINEIRDSIEATFQNITSEGILAEESLRGVRFNLCNAELHPDAIHTGGGQIIATARRVFCLSQMNSSPRFQEPIFLYNITAPKEVKENIYKFLKQKRGFIITEESYDNFSLLRIKGYLPVSETFGFDEEINSVTYGQAFIDNYTFSHWDTLDDNPFDIKSKAYDILINIRKRKGMKQELPNLDDFLDKI